MSDEPVEDEAPQPSGDFEFRGHQRTTYPSFLHPERDGVLIVDPGEQVAFGDQSPPPDGLWYDVVSGEPWTGPLPDVVADEPGTGDDAPQEQEG